MPMIEFVDSTAAKIVLAVDRGDSINRIANKISISYSWVYDWIERLNDEEFIAKTDNGIQVVDHEMRRRYDTMMGAVYSRERVSPEDAYVIPHFAGMEFAYTEIDAAYVWTHGGYQVARSHDDYPVFVRVHDRDVERWIAFCERYGIDVAIDTRPDAADVDGHVSYVLFPTMNGFDVDWVDGNPVIPLDEVIEQVVANRPAYEPALEQIADDHDLDIDAKHHSQSHAE